EDRHHVRWRYWRWRPDFLQPVHLLGIGLEGDFFPVREPDHFTVAGDVRLTFLEQEFVLVALWIIPHHCRALWREGCGCPGHNYLRLRSLNVCRSRQIDGSGTDGDGNSCL